MPKDELTLEKVLEAKQATLLARRYDLHTFLEDIQEELATIEAELERIKNA